MMNHVKEAHGETVCHRFLLNKCTYNNRCLFSHIVPQSQRMEKTPEKEILTPTAPTEEGFLNLPTSGPVEGAGDRAQPHMVAPKLHQMSREYLEIIRQSTTQAILKYVQQILPQITNQIMTDLQKVREVSQ